MSHGAKKRREHFNNTCQIYMDGNEQFPGATGRINWIAGGAERLQWRAGWDMCPGHTGHAVYPLGEH